MLTNLLLIVQNAGVSLPGFLQAAAAIFLPGVVTWLALQVAKLVRLTETWEDASKRLFALTVAYGMSLLNGLVPGLEFPLVLGGLSAEFFEGALSFGVSQALFLVFKRKD